jgi:hypothetical protein
MAFLIRQTALAMDSLTVLTSTTYQATLVAASTRTLCVRTHLSLFLRARSSCLREVMQAQSSNASQPAASWTPPDSATATNTCTTTTTWWLRRRGTWRTRSERQERTQQKTMVGQLHHPRKQRLVCRRRDLAEIAAQKAMLPSKTNYAFRTRNHGSQPLVCSLSVIIQLIKNIGDSLFVHSFTS